MLRVVLLFLLPVLLMGSGPISPGPPMGAVLIGPMHGDWTREQLPVVWTAGFTVVKVHIPVGFQTGPELVEKVLHPPVRTVILRSEDCIRTPEEVWRDLVDRGYWDLMARRPDIRWAVEVGNEPDLSCPGMTPERFYVLSRDLGKGLQTVRERAELILSLPVEPTIAQMALESRSVLDLYDGLGVHVYGYHRMTDNERDQVSLRRALATGKPVWITEAGIDDPAMDKTEKARRVQSWARDLPDQVQAVVLFTVGRGTHWPQYEIDLRMAAQLGNCRWFPETGMPLCPPFRAYWEQVGLPVLGFPVTPPVREDGRLVQYTERAVLEWHPEAPSGWQVQLRRLGAEAAQRSGFRGTGIP
jgi:hypothetical protein